MLRVARSEGVRVECFFSSKGFVTSGSVVHVLRLFPGKEYVQAQCRTGKIMGAVEGMSLILSFSDLSAFIGMRLGTCAFGLFYVLGFFFSVGGRFSLEMMIKQFQQVVSSSELVPEGLLHFSCERSGFGHRFASAPVSLFFSPF